MIYDLLLHVLYEKEDYDSITCYNLTLSGSAKLEPELLLDVGTA